MTMWIMSDRAIPRSFRFMEGFGVHTFRFVDRDGRSKFVKFHWRPKLGLQSVIWNEGFDPDFHRRDLWDAIQSGNFPEWNLGLQIFDDASAIGSHSTFSTRQKSFQRRTFRSNGSGRNFSYLDTQFKRLGGPNFTHLPINAPKCPFRTLQQDGHMAMVNPTGRVNYEPNSWGGAQGGPREASDGGFRSYPAEESGRKQRVRSDSFADHYSQARQFYFSQTEVEREHIAAAFSFELGKVDNSAIRARMVSHLLNVDHGLAEG
jgi:catalase